jgi:adenine-specific DNA-methyltransferase
LYFKETLTPFDETYIKEGILKNYHRRSHSLRRKVWYVIDTGNIPDAFFPYRVHKTPYLVKNNLKVQCTNSIHRLYFKNITDIELQWIQVSLLSIPGQLSIERYSKIYGSGLLKIEPKALKKAIIYKDNNYEVKTIYENISKLLHLNKREEAVNIASRFMATYLNIPDELMRVTKKAYSEIKKRRLERN